MGGIRAGAAAGGKAPSSPAFVLGLDCLKRAGDSEALTVLAEYQRLEAEGVWRPAPDAQRRGVIVSIGDATITIAAPNGTALTHWSLPAMRRLNPGEPRAVYAPGEDTPETLEVSDAEMVAALDRVLGAIGRGPARSRWAMRLATLSVSGGVAALAVFWLPGAITAYTASLVPAEARAQIGASLLEETRRVTGASCRSPGGDLALARLTERLFPEAGTRLVVLPSTLKGTAHLPGGIMLVSNTLVEDYETPDVLAGHLIAEAARREARDPMARLLAAVPFRASLALLSTGRLRESDLERMAEWVVAAPPEPVEAEALVEPMAAAGIAPEAYARAVDISGETTGPLLRVVPEEVRPVLEDTDWIALQRICLE